jgi:hypothetical protein
MTKAPQMMPPEDVLAAIYGKTSLELGMSEKRRDEMIAAAIFASFRNQEFGTRLKLPADYKNPDLTADAQGIDVVARDSNGRKKEFQIKGIYIQRSIERRRKHMTRGAPAVYGRKTRRQIIRDSEELTKIMEHELEKIRQDYSGIYLIIHVIADLASQTSLGIAIKNSRETVASLKAKEVWFLRQIPVRMLRGRMSACECYAYKLIKVFPDKHTYGFSFAL